MTNASLIPQWPAPPRVRSLVTTRAAGDLKTDEARAKLRGQLPAEPLWLKQVHGTTVVDASSAAAESEADAAVAQGPGRVLAIMTADCLPVLLCNRAGTVVAAAHAGWRGLVSGILERTVQSMKVPAGEVIAYLGPGIGAAAYEVGPELRQAFVDADPAAADAFKPGRGDRFHADLYALARQRLSKAGIMAAFGGMHCTFNERELFFSYRRDGVTGRMASLVWLDRD